MGLGELLEQGAEDGELGLEGLGLVRPEDVAVAGVLRRGDAASVEGGEADSFARHRLSLSTIQSNTEASGEVAAYPPGRVKAVRGTRAEKQAPLRSRTKLARATGAYRD